MPRRYHTLESSEYDFEREILKAADKLGWYRHHDHDSRKQDWLADSGYPDLTLAHRSGRLLFAELKTKRGKLTQAQEIWLEVLGNIPSVEVYVWRPDDWPEIERVLKGETIA